jgi:Sulfotransferase family
MVTGNLLPTTESARSHSIVAKPVFILGITERSGTTYLQDLLRIHPDCDVDGLELNEDHFVASSHLLVEFVKSASRSWKAWWGAQELQNDRDLVLKCLGDGLISYLHEQVRRRRALTGVAAPAKPLKVLVTKTPNVANLHLVFKLFPGADLLILIRDGRAVVESAVGTFYRSSEWATRQWADHARTILRFLKEDSDAPRKYLVVKYEDLYRRNAEELGRILSFLQLDPTVYNFEGARDLPVRGSSSLRRKGAERVASFVAPGVHWRPVPRAADFDPVNRWNGWSRAKHERFNWIAGQYLTALGYEQKIYSGGVRWPWAVWNYVLDALPIEKTVWILQKVYREIALSSNKLETALTLLSKAVRGNKSHKRLQAHS